MGKGVKTVRQLTQFSEIFRNLFQELKEPKPLQTERFCKTEEKGS